MTSCEKTLHGTSVHKPGRRSMERLYIKIGLELWKIGLVLAPMAVFDADWEQLTACNSPTEI